MKIKILLVALLLGALMYSCDKDDEDPLPVDPNPPIAYNANLTGQQEVPPNNSEATGYVNFWLNQYTKVLYGKVHFSGMSYTAGHVHRGDSGVAGPPIFPFTEPPSNGVIEFTTTAALDSAQMAALEAGELYVNLHSTAFPDGEIRGQLIRQVDTIGSGGYK